MSDEQDKKIEGHSYDGIEEYDNNLPNWWLVTFYLTIIFSFVYWTKYYVFTDKDPQEIEYSQALEKHEQKLASLQKDVSDEDIIAMANDAAVIARAKEAYVTNCQVCHGANGEGGIGPNLTDAAWIHGYEPSKIIHTINQGVLEKGMTAWKGVLSESTIHELAAYVISLEGSNPDNAKEPQGDIIKG
ncbi:c-type cytochrome [bacterium]|nr:c-type cytochrome [bacterium]